MPSLPNAELVELFPEFSWIGLVLAILVAVRNQLLVVLLALLPKPRSDQGIKALRALQKDPPPSKEDSQ